MIYDLKYMIYDFLTRSKTYGVSIDFQSIAYHFTILHPPFEYEFEFKKLSLINCP